MSQIEIRQYENEHKLGVGRSILRAPITEATGQSPASSLNLAFLCLTCPLGQMWEHIWGPSYSEGKACASGAQLLLPGVAV